MLLEQVDPPGGQVDRDNVEPPVLFQQREDGVTHPTPELQQGSPPQTAPVLWSAQVSLSTSLAKPLCASENVRVCFLIHSQTASTLESHKQQSLLYLYSVVIWPVTHDRVRQCPVGIGLAQLGEHLPQVFSRCAAIDSVTHAM